MLVTFCSQVGVGWFETAFMIPSLDFCIIRCMSEFRVVVKKNRLHSKTASAYKTIYGTHVARVALDLTTAHMHCCYGSTNVQLPVAAY